MIFSEAWLRYCCFGFRSDCGTTAVVFYHWMRCRDAIEGEKAFLWTTRAYQLLCLGEVFLLLLLDSSSLS